MSMPTSRYMCARVVAHVTKSSGGDSTPIISLTRYLTLMSFWCSSIYESIGEVGNSSDAFTHYSFPHCLCIQGH